MTQLQLKQRSRPITNHVMTGKAKQSTAMLGM
jgi:hypothetical protein